MNTRRLSTLILAFALTVMVPGPSTANAMVLDRIVAVVGEESITWVDLRMRMEEELAPQLKGISFEERASALEDIEGEFLQSLIARSLQLQEARKFKLNATSLDIDRAIEDIRSKYNLDPEEFKQTISKEGLKWDRYRQMIGDQISMQRIVDKMVKSQLPKPTKLEGDSDLYKVRLMLFATEPDKGQDSVQQKVDTFVSELNAGASFEELEARYSNSSAGTLEIKESNLSKELKTALSGMSPAEISAPFMTDKGVMIVKLYARIAPEDLALERMFKERYRRWLKELTENAYIDIRL